MPLTISHAAAAVPFSRFGLNLPSLIIGSMIPDFIYFVGLHEHREMTHSLAGLFVCVAAGLIVLWIYDKLAKGPVLSLMPHWVRKAASGKMIAFWPPRRLLILSLSILVGAATHLIWDSFTHESGWVVDHVPLLQMTVLDFGFDKVPLSRLLHHAGSLIGAVFIVIWTRRYYLNRIPQAAGKQRKRNPRKRIRAALVLAFCIVSGLLLSWAQISPIDTYDQLRRMMVGSIFASGSVLLSFTFSYCALWHLRKARR